MSPNHIRPALTAALLAGGLAIAFGQSAGAQVYKWTDEKGRVTYSSTPPPGKIKAEPIQLRGVESYTAGPSQAPVAPAGGGGGQGGGAPAPSTSGTSATAEARGDASCGDGRTNCTREIPTEARSDAPESGFPDRTNERVRPQFTVGVPTPTPTPKAK